MTMNFSVNYRNPGHWDVSDHERRLFCIRGGRGAFVIRDEREGMDPIGTVFPTVDAAMTWICSVLMFEYEPCLADRG